MSIGSPDAAQAVKPQRRGLPGAAAATFDGCLVLPIRATLELAGIRAGQLNIKK